MIEKRIKMELGDSNWLMSEAKLDEFEELRITLPDAMIVLPPHLKDGRNFGIDEILTGIAVFAGNVAAGVVATYLYDALKSGKLRRIFIGKKEVSSKEEIEEALKTEE